MIEIQDFSFCYPGQEKPVVQHVDLQIQQGEVVLLCGRSGCGKSTLLKAMNGMIPHVENGTFSGTVLLNQKNIAEIPMYLLSQEIGSVFQNPKSQFFNLDSDSELAFSMENAGYPPEQIQRRIEEMTKLFQIQHIRGRSIFEMSGGEKQILAIASVCAAEPAVYIMDEPTANLDISAIEKIKSNLEITQTAGENNRDC